MGPGVVAWGVVGVSEGCQRGWHRDVVWVSLECLRGHIIERTLSPRYLTYMVSLDLANHICMTLSKGPGWRGGTGGG